MGSIHRLPFVLTVIFLLSLGGCGSISSPSPLVEVEDVVGEPPVILQVVMWIPNRILDALDIVRFGVGAGPGMGVDVRATRLAQVSAMSGMAIGLGWQGHWNSPVMTDTRMFLAAGPVTLGSTSLNPVFGWQRTDWEIRAEVHAAIVLAEAAVDLYQVFDFMVGILFFDPGEDDILGPHWF